jgi:opacity protein-like surface antigen
MHKPLFAAFAAALLASAPPASAAEIGKGTIEVTGRSSLGIALAKDKLLTQETGQPDQVDTEDQSAVDVEGGAVYYLSPNLGVGLELGVARESVTAGVDKTTDTALRIGPKVVGELGVATRLSVFGEAAILFARESHLQDDTSDTAAPDGFRSSGFGLGLVAGVKYFPVKWLSVNAAFDFLFTRVQGKPDPDRTEIHTRSVPGGFVGLSAYFGN